VNFQEFVRQFNIKDPKPLAQCCGSMYFGTNPDSDSDPDANPDIFASDLQEINKKLFFVLLFQGTFT
jgi:hypothetical protein